MFKLKKKISYNAKIKSKKILDFIEEVNEDEQKK